MSELLVSPLAGILSLERPLIVLDYETTGVDPATARICSIGMRRHNVDGTLQPYKTLVNPDILMPRDAEGTHGITQEIIDHGCAFCWGTKEEHPWSKCEKWRPIHKFATLAPRLLPVMTGVDFCGYHIDYDLRVAAEEFERCGMVFDYSKAKIIDSLRIEQVVEPRTLSAVYERRTGKKLEGAHDAMIDVLATEEVFIDQLLKSSDLPRTIDQLHDLLWPPDPDNLGREGKFRYADNVLMFTFGKWKGRSVKSQLSYVQWMLRDGGFSPEIRALCKGILDGRIPLIRKSNGDNAGSETTGTTDGTTPDSDLLGPR